MKYLIACIIVLCTIIFLLSHYQIQTNTVTKTKYIKLTYERTDTIERIKHKYRYITDSVNRWIFDSTWNNVCRRYSDSTSKESCQRDVVRQLLSGQLNAALVSEYQTKWEKDSTWIQSAIQLDSIKNTRIENLISKNEELGNVNKKHKRIAKVGHIAAGLLGAILIMKP